MPAFSLRSHSPDGASTDLWWQHYCSLLLIYRPRNDERLSWPSWLTYSRRFTHISGHPLAVGRVQDSESSPVKDQRSTAEPCSCCCKAHLVNLCIWPNMLHVWQMRFWRPNHDTNPNPNPNPNLTQTVTLSLTLIQPLTLPRWNAAHVCTLVKCAHLIKRAAHLVKCVICQMRPTATPNRLDK